MGHGEGGEVSGCGEGVLVGRLLGFIDGFMVGISVDGDFDGRSLGELDGLEECGWKEGREVVGK